jgi:hypothetical protein
MVAKAVELVWFENQQAVLLLHPLSEPVELQQLCNALAPELQAKFASLQPSRFGKRINDRTLVAPFDQIAWLAQVQVDPQSARVARVEKQRKERWRQKSIPRRERTSVG